MTLPAEARAVTEDQVRNALHEWQEFWPAPKHVETDAGAQAFRRHYLEAVNAEPLVRKHWDRVVVRIKSRSRWFPYPADLVEAAKVIAEERRA